MAMSPPSSSFDLKLLFLLPLILLYLVLPTTLCKPLEHPGCLAGSWHKRHPSPEPTLPACRNYTKKSCCTPQETSVFVTSPISRVDPISWDRCGNLSLRCEGYFKRVECFNRCSPMAIQWAHPAHPGLLHHTPLCLDFCNGWFHSCAEDLTCVRNWIYDWDWNIEGNLCPGPCTPFKQMYRDGRDLCETIWGLAFLPVSTEDCISPGCEARNTDQRDSNEDGRINFRTKRSPFLEEIEGSGSGF